MENLHHRLTTSVFLNANYDQLESLPEGMGRFHCLYNAGTNPGYEPLTILQTKGHGHFIGCSLSMQSWLQTTWDIWKHPSLFISIRKTKVYRL